MTPERTTSAHRAEGMETANLKVRSFIYAGCSIMLLAATGAAAAQPPPKGPPRALPITRGNYTGDFDGMLERRVIRVLAPYSRTFFFNERGRERGYSADLVRGFEKYLNQKLPRSSASGPSRSSSSPRRETGSCRTS